MFLFNGISAIERTIATHGMVVAAHYRVWIGENETVARGQKKKATRIASRREFTRALLYEHSDLGSRETGVISIVDNYGTDRGYRLEPLR